MSQTTHIRSFDLKLLGWVGLQFDFITEQVSKKSMKNNAVNG